MEIRKWFIDRFKRFELNQDGFVDTQWAYSSFAVDYEAFWNFSRRHVSLNFISKSYQQKDLNLNEIIAEKIKIPQGRDFRTKLSLSATSPTKYKKVFKDEIESSPLILTPWAKVNLFHLKD